MTRYSLATHYSNWGQVVRRRDDLSGIVPKIRLLPEALSSEEELTMGISAPGRAMAARWIHTGHSAVNLAQVCRIEYRRNDVSCKEICGFDLYLVDGTAVTLYWGEPRSPNQARWSCRQQSWAA